MLGDQLLTYLLTPNCSYCELFCALLSTDQRFTKYSSGLEQEFKVAQNKTEKLKNTSCSSKLDQSTDPD